ncbi:bifunctional tRNA (5-methylaminomethyl-2-thiouridine)(34)-methyltransferase MnmD/FAD-dependent 5-carboxymethylaminomethyl-2-thiouridine(34) oxidoreductase MnmC [Ferrimonas balearica]|uniref:bifunctional tRNA (5-methylaminomethyl-2-thiouridine)(34)-methyltransferase MnmD/FAD-dependent 5-carboxymethylaminomethyl-2-thiouridine(34) oxidoreductase MnmC n=1 Tax=Ferrimonas balearica TaxID=44012 RepID=UPI001C99D3DF|nr:bifunctional tRNA (5-methylaminomethyl-2-thiouridine)(34)-methyltransferase MnmD/FAD-dependent 5-carboxymethylaminomethyl-2-thiouridine(34) oxidoreductase MnmC [Ferrimonas balearica]MBY5922124.1 bifunctional tRNA (5-methylaminomethyl-2-thiouridine)(34)-methyltransferase MnmD/FAD-dependent 5-carboxymethylaminomethyl-2-thiouridine(34) oxidoreductase MnmC [Ferrimonas balearica]MBY5994536.1 bifunctional tRNA (5-methylaminomethyl-2-thiouridine)(34)-methyltransferase MnmD/FAD-dependent 5-carboxymeth
MSVSPSSNTLESASIDWSDPAAPVSTQFDDVYFSKHDGAAETDYVFLQHNQLPSRWADHPRRHFSVAETGFGTGLNLLVLWQRFNAFRQTNPDARCRRLHFVSFEKYPLNVTDLSRAHRQWPQFEALAAELRSHYPPATEGCHRLLLQGGEVVVDLWFGDVLEQLPGLDAGDRGVVDAWFLDGFAPSKNPDMWQPVLFNEMARLSRPEATFATFTAAGIVRRGLQDAGFEVEKVPGFGRKREMARGRIAEQHYAALSEAAEPDAVTLVGAGLAGAATALGLVRRGVRVDLYCQDEGPAQGASGNRQGAIYPLLNQADDGLSRFYQQAFPLARQLLLQMVAREHPIAHDLSGVLQLGVDEKSQNRLDALAQQSFPTELAHGVDAESASRIAGVPLSRGGLYYPLGGWLCPAQLTDALLAEAEKSGLLTCHYRHQLQTLTPQGGQWQLEFDGGHKVLSDQVVLALGHQSNQFEVTAPLPLNPVRGQISYPEAGPTTAGLKTVLCADGYLVPEQDGRLTCGASFGRGDASSEWRETDKAEIVQRMANSFGQEPWEPELVLDDSGRAAVRAAVRDHLPLVGPVPDWDTLAQWTPDTPLPLQPGLHLITGLGSRGLCSGALCAELLLSQLMDEPRPQSQEQQARLTPGRFWIRKRVKGQPVTR